MLKALKIRLYPNKTQATQINKLLGCYRFVYNQCLEKKINSYKENETSETLTTLGYFFHNELTKDERYSWLQEQNTKVLKQTIIDLLDAYSHFFNEPSYSSGTTKLNAQVMRKYYDEIYAEFQDEIERGFLNGEDIRAMMNTLIINAEGKRK